MKREKKIHSERILYEIENIWKEENIRRRKRGHI